MTKLVLIAMHFEAFSFTPSIHSSTSPSILISAPLREKKRKRENPNPRNPNSPSLMENKSASDGYVIRSAVRPGFKHELERPLQTQSEASSFSLSRIRCGNKKARTDISESRSGEKKNFESAEELIRSGLIDGLMMEYLPKPDDVSAEGNRLRAKVSSGRLLCNCGFCRSQVKPALDEFQFHAGCPNWDTMDSVFFENGSSFRDVLAACNASPADKLESALKNSLGCDVRDLAKRVYNCRRCKVSIQTSLDEGFRLYRRSCLELKRVRSFFYP